MKKLGILFCLCLILIGCMKPPSPSPAPETIQITETGVTAVEVHDFARYYELFNASDEERNWYHAALGCLFSRPEDIDLNFMFYLGTDGGSWNELSEQSRQYLISKEFMWEMDLQVMPVPVIDEILMNTLGISINDASIPEEWEYIEYEHAYCSNHNDAYFPEPINITAVTEYSNGTVEIFYSVDYFYDTSNDRLYENPSMVLKLNRTESGDWHIYSNTIG